MARSRTVYVRETTSSKMFEQGRVRLLCVALFFVLCFGAVSWRLVELMFDGKTVRPTLSLASLAQGDDASEEQDVTNTESRLSRADIVDRNGVVLATSLMTASAFVNPQEVSDIDAAAASLAKALGMDKTTLTRRMNAGKSFVWVKRNLTPKEQKAVNTLGIPGVYFLPEERRVYPYGNVLAHVIGYVGVDNKGLAGIEKSYDARLNDGADRAPLTLTIDSRVQQILHDEIQTAITNFNAIGGVGLVMDVKTGEIVAMSSMPDFNPHRPAQATDDSRFNRATLGAYEMGSTFKSFTMALGFETKTVTNKSLYDASPLKYANFTITDTHPIGHPISVTEIFAHSSNVGTARMLLDVGVAKQREFMKKIGMLDPIAIDYPETAKPLFPKEWQQLSGITISYGHGISVTPLHLVRGVSALVNGGTLPNLHLVEGAAARKPVERVVSEETSQKMRNMFRLVVTHGTGGKAEVVGYHVGGKTGTAEKITASGHYNKDDKMSSFIGMFPAHNPKYAVLVMIDSPKGNASTYGFSTGGWVAAPAVGNIVSRMGPLLNIAPEPEAPVDAADAFWVSTEKKPAQMAKKSTASGNVAQASLTGR
jgi:cell division protein FtsI (penicillin-binding protein 3)